MKPRSGSNQANRTTPWVVVVDGHIHQAHHRYVNGAWVHVHRNRHATSPGIRSKWWVQIDVPFEKGKWVRVWGRPGDQTVEAVKRFADRQAKKFTEAFAKLCIDADGIPGVRTRLR